MKPAVDFERLREISDNDPEMVNTLIEMYLEQTREILDVLKVGIAKKDFRSVGQSAHKAVGSSATCGMEAIVPFLKELERLGAAENLDAAESLLTQAEEAFRQICIALEDYKDKNLQ